MILVTGAAGFIGSNLVAALAAKGINDIVVCDYLGKEDKWRNLAKHQVADIVDPKELFCYLEKYSDSIDMIFHMGAISSTVETDVDLIIKSNFKLSLDLWTWCAVNQTGFIYASSAATYGEHNTDFDDDGSCEALARLLPLNAYGWSKHLFDRRVARLVVEGAKSPPQWAGLKFFNVYGPNEYHKGNQQSVVAQIFEQIQETGKATLFQSHNKDFQDGGQLRDFIWVGDCVNVMVWLSENPDISGLFNCGSGSARSFKELAEAVFSSLDKKSDIIYIPTPENIRDKYQYFTEANMDRLRLAGYTSKSTSLEEGIKQYVTKYLLLTDPYC
jgi:ADP-L-glycero-D-manno-heptose 6-epimerase